ncbi:MAG: hypothetical protein IJS54_05275 [Desulfovibrio sp.]|nr:hypothetical protein [Desulfovibrio sp.]
MSNNLGAEKPENRANWKSIARKDKKGDAPSLADLSLGIAGTNGSVFLLFQDEPYCIFEGSLYQMLPVEEPSMGYKLVDTSYDRKTILARAVTISEIQALDIMFVLMKE